MRKKIVYPLTASSGGSTPVSVTASDVDSESATSGQVLTANGVGGATWETPASGGDALYLHCVHCSSVFATYGFNMWFTGISKSATPYTGSSGQIAVDAFKELAITGMVVSYYTRSGYGQPELKHMIGMYNYPTAAATSITLGLNLLVLADNTIEAVNFSYYQESGTITDTVKEL